MAMNNTSSGRRHYSLIILAFCLFIFLALPSVTVKASPSRYGTNEGRGSKVFDLLTPEDIPSDGEIAVPAEKSADPRKVQRKTADPETESYIPLVMIVIGFDGQSYNATYDWHDTIFGEGYSVSQYYKDMSFDKFTFTPVKETSAYGVDGNELKADRVDDGIIAVTLDIPKNEGWAIYDNDLDADLENTIAFVKALELADKYIDFSEYDSNADGEIQTSEMALGFVVAGRDAAWHETSYSSIEQYYFWPNAYSISETLEYWKDEPDGFPEVPVLDGVEVDSYIGIADTYEYNGRYDETGSNLRQEGIGTLAHELGHYIGLPDLYDTGNGSSAWKNYSPEYLSVMDLGCYGEDRSGNLRPYSMDIWSRVTLGWVDAVTLDPCTSENAVSIEGSLNASAKDPIALRVNTHRSDEYYLIENRRFTGWDIGMGSYYKEAALSDGEDYGGGLVLWHIDDEVVGRFSLPMNTVNNSEHRPGVMPLFRESGTNGLIGTTVYRNKAFFNADSWGKALQLPVYNPKEYYADKPADRTMSSIILSLDTGNQPVMKIHMDEGEYDLGNYTVTFDEQYHVLDDIESTVYEDWFYDVPEGTILTPIVARGDTILGEECFTATYWECKFYEERNEWDKIDENAPIDHFPTEAGVYFCKVEGKAPYYGAFEWIDLIRIIPAVDPYNLDNYTVTFDEQYHVFDDIESTDYEDWFYDVPEGTILTPIVAWGDTVLGEECFTATYWECKFYEERNEWDKIDENAPIDHFPTEAGVYFCKVEGKTPYYGSFEWIDLIRVIPIEITPKEITPEVILSKKSYTYDGKVKTPTVTVKDGEEVLEKDKDYTVSYASGRKNAGTYKVTVTLQGNYSGTAEASFTIKKAANPLKIKAKTATVKFSALKKKTQTLAVSKVITFTKKGQGTMSYTKASGNKNITINKKTGKVTEKKGLKKGNYKVKVKVKAAGNKNYKASAVKTVTITIRVK